MNPQDYLLVENIRETDLASRSFRHLQRSLFAFLAVMSLLFFAALFMALETQRLQRFEAEAVSLQSAVATLLAEYNIQGLQPLVEDFASRYGLSTVQVRDTYGSVVAISGGAEDGAETRLLVLQDRIGQSIGELEMAVPQYRLNPVVFSALIGLYTLVVAICYWGVRRLSVGWLERAIVQPMQRIFLRRTADQTLPIPPDMLPSMSFLAEELATANSAAHDAQSRAEHAEKANAVMDQVLKLSLAQNQEAVVFVDQDRFVLKGWEETDFKAEEVDQLKQMLTSRKPLSVLVEEAGLQLLDMKLDETHLSFDRCFVQRDEKTEWEFHRHYGRAGQALLTVKPAKRPEWFDGMLDQALRNAKSGLAVFDPHGHLRMEVGASARVMLPQGQEDRNFYLSDLLANFPKLENFSKSSAQNFDVVADSGEVLRIWIKANGAGWVAIHHQDVTEMLQREKQLIESQRLKELGEIASGVAHDFNNSLGVVIGQLELAMSYADAEHHDRQTALATAKRAAEQASGVVGQLMAYSRKQVLNAKIVNIDQLIEDNKRVLSSALTGKHALHLELNADRYVYVDPEYLSAAVMNLVINARDAMTQNGSVTISTRVWTPPQGGDTMVELIVADTGTGIPPHIQEKIFAPFFSTKPTGHGNGLGLSMVKGFVEQSNGQIGLDTAANGTKMKIRFPAIEAHQATNPPKPAMQPAPVNADTALRILMIDDDPLVLSTQSALLRHIGFDTEEMDSPRAALADLKKNPAYDLLIIDMQMPEMHGLDLAEQVRKFAPDLPIIACSGNFDPENVARANALRISKLVEKPASLATLRNAIQSSIGPQRPTPKLVVSRA